MPIGPAVRGYWHVNTDELRARAAPSTSAKILAVRKRGTNITVVSQVHADGRWWLRSMGGRYYAKEYMKPGRYKRRRRLPRPTSPVPGFGPSTPWRKKPNDNTYWQTRGYHTGTDFKAPTGSRVVALRDCTIITVFDQTLGICALAYERSAIGRRYTRWYCHLARVTVQPGVKIKRGQKIAEVDSTGSGARGPHLHMERRAGWTTSWKGKDLNPMWW